MTARARSRLIALVAAAAIVFAPLLAAAPARADADDFSYDSWQSQYRLGRDGEGRAELRVTERLVADFPAYDQNHGIIRGLPTWYLGAPLHLHVVSVTDGDGRAVPYDDDTTEDGVRQLKIGDPDAYQHGRTVYTIRYTMRDVVHTPDDRAIDEWYWNLLPLDSAQPIAHFQAELTFDPAVASALTGARSCYTGPPGSTTRCDLLPAGSPAAFSVAQDGVPAGSGVTVAFALRQGTFAPAPARIPDPMTDVVPYPLAGGGALIAVLGTILGVGAMRSRARRSGRGIVVAQYEVPLSLPPILAAVVEGRRKSAMPAEIVHLAVRGAISLSDGDAKPVLELRDPSIAPDPLDAAALTALFPGAVVGTRLDLAVPDDALVSRLRSVGSDAAVAAIERGLLTRRRSTLAVLCGAAGALAGAAALILAIPGMIVGRPAAIAAFVVALLLTIVSVIAVVLALIPRAVLTPAGAEAREHLLGVKEYIRLAEADRIRMLQSYSGAERRGDGSADVIVLYERLLPYAMIFGMEREWGRVLAVEYERADAVPGWYSGYVVGNLVGSLSGMGSSLTATPAPSSSSSSSSGSFGGGFSGGGGGGGSSGGW